MQVSSRVSVMYWGLLAVAVSLPLVVSLGCHGNRDSAAGGGAKWQVTFLPKDKKIARVIAAFRRGGFTGANDGFAVWEESRGVFMKRAQGVLPPYDPVTGNLSMNLSSGKAVSKKVLDRLLALENGLRTLGPAMLEAADTYEYFVYIDGNDSGAKCHFSDLNVERRGQLFARRFYNATDPLW